MWLEDDKKHDISFDIQQLIDSNYNYIGFHPNHLFEFSFHPSMWSKHFFLEHVYQPYLENGDAKKDPEQLLIDYHCSKRKERKDHFQDVNRIHFNGVFKAINEFNKKHSEYQLGTSVDHHKSFKFPLCKTSMYTLHSLNNDLYKKFISSDIESDLSVGSTQMRNIIE